MLYNQINNNFNITFTDSAITQILQINSKFENTEKFLYISVEGGGCSGFQYIFSLQHNDSQQNQDADIILYKQNNNILAKTDPISAVYLQNSIIDFVVELGASYFKVNNPNATAKCGCGVSFAI
jgi:iron-sulfur cluster insertion protein